MLRQAVGICILCLLVGSQNSQAIPTKRLYGARGGSVVLPVQQLPEGTEVTSVIWKHNQDKAADWFEEDEEPTYYGMFKTTATLDMKTWALTLSDLQPGFNGEYSAEVNHKDPSERMHLTVVDPVHGVKGQSITLGAVVPPNEQVEFAQWTHNNTIIVDWDVEERQAKCLYQNMAFDKRTYDLTISDLKPNCSGLYAFMLNNNGKVFYQLGVIDNPMSDLGIILGILLLLVVGLISVLFCIFNKEQQQNQQEDPQPIELLNINGRGQQDGQRPIPAEENEEGENREPLLN